MEDNMKKKHVSLLLAAAICLLYTSDAADE